MPSQKKKNCGPGLRCYWCKRQLQSTESPSRTAATRDHVIPKSQGGRHSVWSCWACNNLKGQMQPLEWQAFMKANPEWWKLAARRKSTR